MRQREGVFLGLQNHNNGSFAMTADQVLRILRETDRENFHLYYGIPVSG